MKYVPFIFTILLWAPTSWGRASTCAEVAGDLREIETHLRDLRPNGSACRDLTPQAAGLGSLTPAQTTYFEGLRCRNLTALDEEIALVESRLVIQDGLKELRTAAVNEQQLISSLTVPPNQASNAVRDFTRHVALGALIQDFVKPGDDLVAQFLSTPGDSDYALRLTRLCEAGDNDEKSLCQTLQENPTEALSEFHRFLSELNASNTKSADLSSYNELLRLRSGASSTTFYQLFQQIRDNGLSDFLKPRRAGTRPTPPTREQMQVIRSMRLALPPANANPTVKALVERLLSSGKDLEVRGQAEILRTTMQDNSERHMARAKARWSQIWNAKAPGQENPCAQMAGADFKSCVSTTAATAGLRPDTSLPIVDDMTQILNSVLSGAQMAIDTEAAVASCLETTRLASLLNPATPVAAQCNAVGLGDVTADEANRAVLLGLRNFITNPEEQQVWLRFRDRAMDELSRLNCNGEVTVRPFYSPACMGLTTNYSTAPLLALSLDSLQVVNSGLRAKSDFEMPDDCTTLPEVLGAICSRAQSADRPAPRKAEAERTPFRRRNPVQADPRNRALENQIVADGVTAALNNVSSSYFNNRSATQNFANSLPRFQAPVQGPVYSYPVSGLANYITLYGNSIGYGSYYNSACTVCTAGYVPNPNLFNGYFGLGSPTITAPQTTAAPLFGSPGASTPAMGSFFGGSATSSFGSNVMTPGQF